MRRHLIASSLLSVATASTRQPSTSNKRVSASSGYSERSTTNNVEDHWKQFGASMRAIKRMLKDSAPLHSGVATASLIPEPVADESDEHVFVGEKRLLDSVGLSDLDIFEKKTPSRSIPAVSAAGASQSVQHLVAQACRIGLLARVAPSVIYDRIQTSLSSETQMDDAERLRCFDDATKMALLEEASARVRRAHARCTRQLEKGYSESGRSSTSSRATAIISSSVDATLQEEHKRALRLLHAFASPNAEEGSLGLHAVTPAALRLCAALRGEASEHSQLLVSQLMDWMEGNIKTDDSAADFSGVPLLSCCTLAMQACPEHFEFNYALLMRYVACLRLRDDGPASTSYLSIQDSILLHYRSTSQLLAPLAESISNNVEHMETARKMLMDMFARTDLGYEQATLNVARQAYAALLRGLSRVYLDPKTRYEHLETIYRTVMLNSRTEVYESPDILVATLEVLCACRMSDRANLVFNQLLSPATKDVAYSSCGMGAMLLSAASAEDDVMRYFSFASQRYPISMGISHSIAAKLLLQQPHTSDTTAALVYSVLQKGVGLQGSGIYPDQVRQTTLFLRLVTFLSQLQSSATECSESHAAGIIKDWMGESKVGSELEPSTALWPSTIGVLEAIYERMTHAGQVQSLIADAIRSTAVLTAPNNVIHSAPDGEIELVTLPSDFTPLEAIKVLRPEELQQMIRDTCEYMSAKEAPARRVMLLRDYLSLLSVSHHLGLHCIECAVPSIGDCCCVLSTAAEFNKRNVDDAFTVKKPLQDIVKTIILPQSFRRPGASLAEQWLQVFSDDVQVGLSCAWQHDYFMAKLPRLLLSQQATGGNQDNDGSHQQYDIDRIFFTVAKR